MKKIILMIVAAFAVAAMCACGGNSDKQAEVVQNTVNEPEQVKREIVIDKDVPVQNEYNVQEPADDIISEVDYPLLDVYFDEDSEWVVVNSAHEKPMMGGDYNYDVITDREVLCRNAEFLSILTVPAGRGTTCEGSFDIYRDGELYKSIEHSGIVNIYSEELMNAISGISKKQAHKIFSGEKVEINKSKRANNHYAYLKDEFGGNPRRTDYPLIDIYFDRKDEWLLVNWSEKNSKYDIIADSEILQWNKEFLSVEMSPKGRGITHQGFLLLYRNGKLYRTFPYQGINNNIINIYSEELMDAFAGSSFEEIAKILNLEEGAKSLPIYEE